MAYWLPLEDWIVHPTVQRKPSAIPRLRCPSPRPVQWKHHTLTPWDTLMGTRLTPTYLLEVPLGAERARLDDAARWAQSHRVIPYVPVSPQSRKHRGLLPGYLVLFTPRPLSRSLQHALVRFVDGSAIWPITPADVSPALDPHIIHWRSSVPSSLSNDLIASLFLVSSRQFHS